MPAGGNEGRRSREEQQVMVCNPCASLRGELGRMGARTRGEESQERLYCWGQSVSVSPPRIAGMTSAGVFLHNAVSARPTGDKREYLGDVFSHEKKIFLMRTPLSLARATKRGQSSAAW